jgi:hypothetical protein
MSEILAAFRIGAATFCALLALAALARPAQGRDTPHDVAAFYFWSAINWAAWSQVSGVLSAGGLAVIEFRAKERFVREALLVTGSPPFSGTHEAIEVGAIGGGEPGAR